ncbi:DUF2062 domain-containing protein [Rhizobium sp. BK251]|uniref:DUF2062 domain-containing protein n=1 Tax=Rhizobium sp. BK251 TaxID=2512125 RepID=UPI00104A1404|nr:DUF2062 domain-containing protein [Rhizobium sp. BK251]
MLFRRRKPPRFREKLRSLIWPRKGPLRPLRYYRMRVLRLAASPYSVAMGVAIGVAISWTPLLGLHVIIAIALAYLSAASVVAAVLGTTIGNPITFPFIWATSWELGHILLGREKALPATGIDLAEMLKKLEISQLWKPVLEPMLIGAIPLALITGVVVYTITFYAVREFQTRRRMRLSERLRALPDGAAESTPTT